ncbi:hypothetical protein [Pyrobaculum sp.]|uniref:hypothetical protein n=1 Tax=Pyrobaculum sp. TaxID=2004705 RepID=UPI00319E9015
MVVGVVAVVGGVGRGAVRPVVAPVVGVEAVVGVGGGVWGGGCIARYAAISASPATISAIAEALFIKF